MAHKCYISFKAEDADYKSAVQDLDHIDMIDKSLNEPINSDNEDYIMQQIREKYLSDSTVTIHLIGAYGAENRGPYEQRFIKRELQASLWSGAGNTKNGILGVVLPSMHDSIYKGSRFCSVCGGQHNLLILDDSTTIREFSRNYFVPHSGCSWAEDQRYCILVPWSEFKNDPNGYIDAAFAKRSSPIAEKTVVRP